MSQPRVKLTQTAARHVLRWRRLTRWCLRRPWRRTGDNAVVACGIHQAACIPGATPPPRSSCQSACLPACLTDLQELGHLHFDHQALLDLLLLLELVLKGAGQHVGEQLEQQRQRQLQEGDQLQARLRGPRRCLGLSCASVHDLLLNTSSALLTARTCSIEHKPDSARLCAVCCVAYARSQKIIRALTLIQRTIERIIEGIIELQACHPPG